MADIFISYRRDDARADAGRLHDRLSQHFGSESVFMDVDDIEPGADFVERLQSTLESCGAVVVVIGKDWLARDSHGQSRLDDPNDFVRIEVAAALERAVPVIPVLVGGAAMPSAEEIPEALKPLLHRQAVEIRHARFYDDAEVLIESLSRSAGSRQPGMSRRTAIALLVAALAIAAGIGIWRLGGPGMVHLRAEPAQVDTEAARAMLARLNFYDARRNASGLGLASVPEQSVIGDHVVAIDKRTGLMWQNSHFGQPRTQARARAAVRQINETGFAGYRNWRLPTLEEAMSLMTPEAQADYHMAAQLNARSAPFIWTADRAGKDAGWVVYYYDGMAIADSDQFNAYVRGVRALKGGR